MSESNDSSPGTCETCQKVACDHTIVLVESIGGITPYVIPSFPFETVRLVHIEIQEYGEDEEVIRRLSGSVQKRNAL